MAEYIWKDQVKIVTRELTRAELFGFWARIVKGGDLNSLAQERLADARLEEHITAMATSGVYIQNGKGWKQVTESCEVAGYSLNLPVTPETLQPLPNSLVDGWMAAAQKENGTLSNMLNFTSRSTLSETSGTNSSETASES